VRYRHHARVLRTLYNTLNYTPAATATSEIGVTGHLDEFANTADLQVRRAPVLLNPLEDMLSCFRSDAISSFTTVLVSSQSSRSHHPEEWRHQ